MSEPFCDLYAKHVKITQLSAAIARANAKAKRTPQEAIELNHLINQRNTLRGTMPPLRVVGGTDHAR